MISSNTFYIELRRVADALRETNHQPTMLFAWDYPTIQRDVADCLANGIECLGRNGVKLEATNHAEELAIRSPNPPQKAPRVRNMKNPYVIVGKAVFGLGRKIRQGLRWIAREKIPILMGIAYYTRNYLHALKVIKQERPDLLVLAGDLVHYDSAVFIKSAHWYGIQSVIVPSTMSNEEEMAESYQYDAKYQMDTLGNKLFGAHLPSWVYNHHGKKLIRLPYHMAAPMEMLRIAPPKPWIMHSGSADAIAVESQAMKVYYEAGSIPQEKLIEVGSLANDRLAKTMNQKEQLRKELYQELGLDPNKGLMLSALPPDQLYLPGGRPKCEFKTYEDILNFWVGSLASVKNYNAVICLHPSVDIRDYRHLEKQGVFISSRPTPDLIPLCDFFVASVSSVIRWAVACQKPVINYDLFHFCYSDYLKLKGVLTFQEKEKFTESLLKFSEEEEYFNLLKNYQIESSGKWGVLDDRAKDRLLVLFDQLMAGTPAHEIKANELRLTTC